MGKSGGGKTWMKMAQELAAVVEERRAASYPNTPREVLNALEAFKRLTDKHQAKVRDFAAKRAANPNHGKHGGEVA